MTGYVYNTEVSYRRFLIDPIPQSLEAGLGGGKFRRVEQARPSGGFSIVVPAPERDSVVVVSAGPAVALAQTGLSDVGRSGQWRELVRAPVKGIGDGR